MYRWVQAWDNWEPEDEWDDMKDELMPEDKPELKAMEEDCDKRAKARRERIREATALKEEGNDAFKQKRYQNAVELYGAALKAAPWITACLTNRAMCYINLKNYKNAVRDCKVSAQSLYRCCHSLVCTGCAVAGRMEQ